MATKARFRREAIEQLRKRSAPRRSYAIDKRLLRQLRSVLEGWPLRRVMLYVPMDLEADVRPLIAWLRKRGVKVYVPFMEGPSFRLVEYRLPLETKQFGIKEPKISRRRIPGRIDAAIVPIVGIDRTGRRIGFGRGMYDRFFAREGKRIDRVIFVQRFLCYSPEILTDRHDIRADMLIVGPRIRIDRDAQ
ncbi:5-formyltetrahydrofolate cyclo-ligase [Nitratifractor sp.]